MSYRLVLDKALDEAKAPCTDYLTRVLGLTRDDLRNQARVQLARQTIDRLFQFIRDVRGWEAPPPPVPLDPRYEMFSETDHMRQLVRHLRTDEEARKRETGLYHGLGIPGITKQTRRLEGPVEDLHAELKGVEDTVFSSTNVEQALETIQTTIDGMEEVPGGPCPACNGLGTVPADSNGVITCSVCGGEGR